MPFPTSQKNQVIVFTEWMGRSPQIIEDQGNVSAGKQPAGNTECEECSRHFYVRDELCIRDLR